MNKAGRWLTDSLLVIHILLVVLLQSRVAIFALIIAGIILLVSHSNRIPVWKVIKTGGIIAVLSVILYGSSSKVRNAVTDSGILVSTVNFDNDERWKIWNSTAKLIGEKPITGWGSGNWKILYPRYGLSHFRYSFGRHATFDHAHNLVLEYASEIGIIGLAGLLFLLFFPLHSLVKIRNETSGLYVKRALLYLSLSVIIYFTISSFYGIVYNKTYELNAAEVLWIAVIAIISHVYQKTGLAKVLWEVNSNLIKILLFSAVSLSMVWYFFMYRNECVNSSFGKWFANGEFELAREELESVYQPVFNLFYKDIPIDTRLGVLEIRIGNLEQAAIHLEKAVSLHPYHTMSWFRLGDVYYGLGSWEQAENAYRSVYELNRNHFHSRIRLAQIALIQNEMTLFDEYLRFYQEHILPSIERVEATQKEGDLLRNVEWEFYLRMCDYQDRVLDLLVERHKVQME